MKITEVNVSAGRVIPHPTESYSNLRAGVVVKATIEDGEDMEAVVKALQAKAEKLIEDHKNHLLESIRNLERLSQEEAELSTLEQRIKSAQERIADIRAHRPAELSTSASEENPYPYDEQEPGS